MSSSVTSLRRMARPAGAVERCDLCRSVLPDDHRHLLQLEERRILCVCEPCRALRGGDAGLRPVGTRTIGLPDFALPDELWSSFQIPIGLAFFLHSSVTDSVVAMYPSPVGATESELRLDAWRRLVELNPALRGLEPDAEGLIVDRRLGVAAIAPIDRCYELVGLIKSRWEGISGGDGVERAIAEFFVGLR
jgi:Family of unknown function (DUF5947)